MVCYAVPVAGVIHLEFDDDVVFILQRVQVFCLKTDDGDLVVHYQVDRHNEELGTIDTSFPTVILSRSPKIMRPVYFVYRPVSSITNITAEEFIDTLYNCTSLPKIPLVRLIE
nr:unnamed protein product [Haemonchus contortus]